MPSWHTSAGSAFYTFDLSGNVCQRLSASAAVLSTDQYDSFGGRMSTATGMADCFGFGGQFEYYTDAATGLVLCGHRYYDPGTGRWLTRDPIGYDGGINLYGYVGNDPVNDSDPSGLLAPNPTPIGVVVRRIIGSIVSRISGPVAGGVLFGGWLLLVGAAGPAGPADEWAGHPRPGCPGWPGYRNALGDNAGENDDVERIGRAEGLTEDEIDELHR